jgi:hypothetical protein
MGVEEIKDINLRELMNEVERVSGINFKREPTIIRDYQHSALNVDVGCVLGTDIITLSSRFDYLTQKEKEEKLKHNLIHALLSQYRVLNHLDTKLEEGIAYYFYGKDILLLRIRLLENGRRTLNIGMTQMEKDTRTIIEYTKKFETLVKKIGTKQALLLYLGSHPSYFKEILES